jgi:hypothetical protein
MSVSLRHFAPRAVSGSVRGASKSNRTIGGKPLGCFICATGRRAKPQSAPTRTVWHLSSYVSAGHRSFANPGAWNTERHSAHNGGGSFTALSGEADAKGRGRFWVVGYFDFDFVCRAPELDGSHHDATIYALIEWLLAQTGKSRGCYCPQLFRLQFHQDSPYTSHVPSNGRWCDGSALGCE